MRHETFEGRVEKLPAADVKEMVFMTMAWCRRSRAATTSKSCSRAETDY